MPADHHVTTMFLGGNKKKMGSAAFKRFNQGEMVNVTISAIVYIPDKIIVGIVFPKFEIENEFPHVTLMVSKGWKPVESNAVIAATCAKDEAFEGAYDAASNGILPAKNAGVHTA